MVVQDNYHIIHWEVKKILFEKKIRTYRITSLLSHINIVDEILQKEGFKISPVYFYPRARVCLSQNLSLGNSIANYFGHIYIQDLSSMLPPLLLSPKPGSMVLDLCASPGGKTAILSELVGKCGVVIANEPNKKRYKTLQKNLERLNLLNVITTSYEGENFPSVLKFKYILADVPCSGWGTAEKNPKVMKLWTGKKIQPLVYLQKKLIERAYYLLDVGGKLIYSTCTTNKEENEEQIKWALKNFPFELVPLKKIESFFYEEKDSINKGMLFIRGHEISAQGFFIACMKKVEQRKELLYFEEDPLNLQLAENYRLRKEIEEIGLSLKNFPEGIFYRKKHKVFFIPSFSKWEKLKAEGIFIGQIKGKSFIPNHRIWSFLSKDGDNILELNDIEKIKKLISGISVSISSSYKFIKLYYKELPLCLLSVKGGRCLISK